jgi:hypothetical protein
LIVGVDLLSRVGAGRGVVGERFVRTVNSGLKFWVSLFAPGGEAFQPDKKSMPVDPGNDLKGQQGILDGEEEKIPICERDAFSGQNTEELAIIPSVIIDKNLQVIIRQVKTKIKFEIEIGEWRDIEVLHHSPVECAVLLEGNKIRFPLSERVPYLRHGGEGGTLQVEAVINRDGVENVSRDSGEGEQLDHSDRLVDPLILEVTGYVFPNRGGSVTDVIVFAEAVKGGAVHLEQAEGRVKCFEFVEIDQEVEDPVEKLVFFRKESPVKDRALVEARVQGRTHGRRCFLTAFAASNPDIQASS